MADIAKQRKHSTHRNGCSRFSVVQVAHSHSAQLIALITGLATAWSDEGGWRWLLPASVMGAFARICCGYRFWWQTDSIDQSYAPFVIVWGLWPQSLFP